MTVLKDKDDFKLSNTSVFLMTAVALLFITITVGLSFSAYLNASTSLSSDSSVIATDSLHRHSISGIEPHDLSNR